MNPFLLRWLPAPLRTRLDGNRQLQEIAANFGWLTADRIVRMGLGVLVGVWVARYLGPERLGIFAYVQAVIALFLGFSTMGLDYIVVRELVGRVGRKSRIMGTALALRLVGAFVALVVSNLVIVLSKPGDHLIHLLAAIMGSAMVFQAFDTIDLWFQSQVQSKYTVLVKNSVFVAMACLKVALILLKASLVAFAWAVLAEYALGALFLLVAYRYKNEDAGAWRVDFRMAKSLMRDGWPLILSGLAVMIFMRIDQIMLSQMGSNKAVGVFSAALRLSEVWYFVPIAVVSSVMPSLVEAKKAGEDAYNRRFQVFSRLMVALALVIVIPMTFFARHLVVILYGPAFAGAGPILAVHIWTAVFVFLGVAQGPWFVIEKLTKLSLKRTLGGAIVNVGLNLYLIPRFGGIGAAVASLFAQITCNLVMNYFDHRTRHLFWMAVKAFNLFSGWADMNSSKGAPLE